MLQLQEKLFFRSIVRVIMLIILLGGGFVYHIWIIGRERAIEEIIEYGAVGSFVWQMYLFVFYFIIMLFLAYDYFRETMDANLLEILQVTRKDWKNSWLQFLVMFQWIIVCAVMVFAFSCIFFNIADTLTIQVIIYLSKLVLLYVVINGFIAILLGWLLARAVGKVIGYVCMILFSCLVSPMFTEELGFLSMVFHELYDWFIAFLIMPEGLNAYNTFTLFPINLSLMARSLFWVFLFLIGIFVCYKRKKRWALVCVLGMVGTLYYMYLPASYYCANESYGASDSIMYDQIRYEIENQSVKRSIVEYNILKYEMKLDMGRQMNAKVVIYPEQKNLESYDMTLYHLYNITKVTDGTGQELEYQREEDYLTIFSSGEEVEKLCIEYNGGCANFYSNKSDIYLPGWFAYYPMPGYRCVYDDYTYMDNRFEESLEFDIEILGAQKVYCDMKRIEKNHFVGESCGPTLLAGFVEEKVLDNGVTCIYSYLDKMADPDAEIAQEHKNIVWNELEKNVEWCNMDEKYIVMLPIMPGGDTPRTVWKHSTINGIQDWRNLANILSEEGQTEEERLARVTTVCVELYSFLMADDFKDTYDSIKCEVDDIFVSYEISPLSDEEFKEFVIENFGEEEWNALTKGEDIGGE